MGTQTPLEPFIGDRAPRVLAVDDEPVHLQILSALLTRWGCTVRTAVDGADALTAAHTESPDLVLLDVILPDQSGFDVCRILQTDPATAHIPIVFLTAMSSADALSRAFETGGHDFLTKPFRSGELAARLGAKLRQKYAEDVLRERRTRFSALATGRTSMPRHEDAR